MHLLPFASLHIGRARVHGVSRRNAHPLTTDGMPAPCAPLALNGEERERRLQAELDKPLDKQPNRESVLRRVAAANALSMIQSGQFGVGTQFWKMPWGEPDWVTVPAGEFWMGSKKGEALEKPLHKVGLETVQIAQVPVTNAQYALFVADQKVDPPSHWRSGRPPKGEENHPVVRVSWYNAQAYCRWLSDKIGRAVRLPTEAEWEKAARGDQDQREYPWGDEWAELKCNSYELGLESTSPVGLFTSGASPYGCLDMAGNVWEWCQSQYASYPYKRDDGREGLSGDAVRVMRGGSWSHHRYGARGASRYGDHPILRIVDVGFRVVVVSPGSHS